MKKSNYYLTLYLHQFIFIRWSACLLFHNASSHKVFLSFETIATNTSLPIQLEAKVNEYLSLIMRLIFAFGISFQLPILLNLLARIGVVDFKLFKTRRRYVIVIIFAAAAILTPPDPITQIGLAIPLLLLI